MPIDTNIYTSSIKRLSKSNPEAMKRLAEEMDFKQKQRVITGFVLLMIPISLMIILFMGRSR